LANPAYLGGIMKLNIKWTDDCQGKKDFDGDIVAISTRYWPGQVTVYDTAHPERGLHEISRGCPSATSTIILTDGFPHHNGDSIDLAQQDFEADTFEEIDSQVQAWTQLQMDRITKALCAEFNVVPPI